MKTNNLFKILIGTACIAFLFVFASGCGCNKNEAAKTQVQSTTEPSSATEPAQPSTAFDEPEINYFDLE
ncbi:MAG: hypothetical protein ACI4HK_03065 [Ruminococcus sp.]